MADTAVDTTTTPEVTAKVSSLKNDAFEVIGLIWKLKQKRNQTARGF